MKNIFYILFLLFSNIVLADFVQSENMKKAYSHIIDLEFDLGKKYIEFEKISNPENGLIQLNENYIDYLSIIIGEEKSYFEKRERLKDVRLKELRNNDQNSPYYLYSQAEIILQWAFIRLKFEEYFTAALELKSAYSLLQQNEKKFPEFDLNNKSLGVLYSLIGSIPEKYQWVVSLLGMEGGLYRGLNKINDLIDKSKRHSHLEMYNIELLFLSSNLHLQLTENKERFHILLNEIDNKYEDNLLLAYSSARLSQKLGYNSNTIKILKNIPKGNQYFPFPYLDYLMGMSKLYELDEDAKKHFQSFIKNTKGNNYLKSAYQKLAWLSIVLENGNYNFYCNKIKLNGSSILEIDKQAQKEANENRLPNKELLKSRLLFDGGYFYKAETILRQLNIDDFYSKSDIIEYWYRLARVSQSLKRENKKVISLFEKSYNLGKKSSHYFGAMSALQIGFIYLDLNNKIKAKEYFEKCLSMNDFDYENGIKMKAKTALNQMD